MGQMIERFLDMPQLRRLAPIGSYDREAMTVDVIFSTGAQVRRFDWWEGEYYIEELDMSPEAVDLTRMNAGAPVLDTHGRYDLSDVLGVVERAWLDEGRGYARLKFSKREEVKPIAADVADGVIRNVSVGYDVLQMHEAGFDPKTGYKIMRVTRWQPFEVSFVPVGADAGAQARTKDAGVNRCRVFQQAPKEPTMAEATNSATVATAEPQTVPAGSGARVSEPSASAVELERARVRGIDNLCKANRIDAKIRDHWVSAGLSLDQVSEDLLGLLEERGRTNPQPATKLGLSEGETQQFSLRRAIHAVVEKDWTQAGFELECSRAIAQKLGKVVNPTSFYVPFEVQQRKFATPVERLAEQMMRRDLTVASASGGGYLVATENIGFIEMLRNRSVAFRMGARRLSGLQGNVTVPKQTAGGTGVWLATESSTSTESAQTFAQMALSPKTISAYTEISRLLLLQSSPDAEGLVMMDLAKVVGLAADVGALRGSGSSGEPTGIVNTSGIGSVTGGSLAYAGILEFQTDVASANVEPASGGYVTTPAVASLMMQRQRFSSTDTPLWVGNIWNGQMAGFAAMSSLQMSAATMLFGDWSELVIGEWGVLEVNVNPFANFQAGIIGVRALYSMDVGLRYPGAFSYATSIT